MTLWTKNGYNATKLLEQYNDVEQEGEVGMPVRYRRFKAKRDGTITDELNSYPGMIVAEHPDDDMVYVAGRSGKTYEVKRTDVERRDPEDFKQERVHRRYLVNPLTGKYEYDFPPVSNPI